MRKKGLFSSIKPRDAALLAILVAILAAVGWYYYIYTPAQERMAVLEEDIARLDSDIATARRAQRSLPKLREDVARLKDERLDFLRELPTENEIAQLIERLRIAALDANVVFDRISSGGAAREDIQDVRPLSFTVSTLGVYGDTLTFLRTLESLKRFTKIREVSFNIQADESNDPELVTDYDFTVYTFVGDDPEVYP